MTPWLLIATALGHGGPPRTHSLMWDASGNTIVSSSHGLIFEDDGYSWVCDEVLGTVAPSEVIQSNDNLLMRSTQGVAFSTDGCQWTWAEGSEGLVIWDIATDTVDPGTVWIATEDGLWRSTDAGESFTFSDTPNPSASIRSFVQMPDMSWTILGFLDGLPMAWRGTADDWQTIDLPARGGHLIALGTDDEGHAYARMPEASGADTLIGVAPDGDVSTLLDLDKRIDAFISLDGAILISVQDTGLQLSSDHGVTWESRGIEPTRCLIVHDEQLFGCPDDSERRMWSYTSLDLSTETTQWLPGPAFDRVSGQRCDASLSCDMVWPQVQRELGLVEDLDTGDTGHPTPDADDVRCGCSQGAAVVLVPWSLLWVRRRA